MDTVGFRVGPDEAEPFFGDDERDEEGRVSEEEEFAEVHHGVDVASSGPRHGHHVADSEWLWFDNMIHNARSEWFCLLLRLMCENRARRQHVRELVSGIVVYS